MASSSSSTSSSSTSAAKAPPTEEYPVETTTLTPGFLQKHVLKWGDPLSGDEKVLLDTLNASLREISVTRVANLVDFGRREEMRVANSLGIRADDARVDAVRGYGTSSPPLPP